ncbi:signal recognition particle-docking protein FtsY [Candidatus Woesearchaeota archaeon]|nr:signal recognition particle-docking protein FtsY [Candidatus Woesearchaeota archaeon]
MFKFLKDKIKETISKISKKVEEEPKVEDIIEESQKEEKKKPQKREPKKETKKQEKKPKQKKEKIKKPQKEEVIEESHQEETIEEETISKKEEKPKKGFFSKLKEKISKKEEIEEKLEEVQDDTKIKKIEEDTREEFKEEILEEPKEKKGFFGIIKEKVTTTKISEDKFNELFEDLEVALLENNVAFEVVDKIKEDLKKDILEKPIKRGEVEATIISSLKESIEDLFLTPKIDLLKNIEEKKPYIICFIGINGSGKTTSIARLAHLLQKNKKSVVLAASDTFRAAAIQQLKEWGSKLNVKVIAHDYGSDPAAVSFDAIEYAKAHNIDVVLIDTAGRLHSNKNLMGEMQKIIRVAKPDLKIFIGEAITGNDCTEQAQQFKNEIGIDGIILTKADVDEKGGTIVSVSHVTHRPIMYLGVGQELDDLEEFNKDKIMKNLGL